MLVDSTMADLSDLTFRTAFILYLAALIMSCIYYGRMFGVLDMRRERARMDQKVAVGAGGGSELIDAPSDKFCGPDTCSVVACVRAADTFGVLPLTGGADRVSARRTTGEWILCPRGGR